MASDMERGLHLRRSDQRFDETQFIEPLNHVYADDIDSSHTRLVGPDCHRATREVRMLLPVFRRDVRRILLIVNNRYSVSN